MEATPGRAPSCWSFVLKADFALIMAMAGETVVAEVDGVVPVGAIPPP